MTLDTLVVAQWSMILETVAWIVNGELISVSKHNYNYMLDDDIYWQSKQRHVSA